MSEYKKQKGRIDGKEIVNSKKSSLLSGTEKDLNKSLDEMDDIRSRSFQGHAALLGDSHFAGSTNSEQKARILNQLQQSHGNAYVQRLLNYTRVQAKLTVSSPDSVYEKEADIMADAVARELNDRVQRQVTEEEEEEEVQAKVHRQVEEEEEEEVQAKVYRQVEEEEEEEVQAKVYRQEEEEEEEEMQAKLQRQEEEEEELLASPYSGSQAVEVSADLENGIESARGSGHPISNTIRKPMEQTFGTDFSNVRLHTDDQADSLSQGLQARAFTTGSDIFFRRGEYNPDSEEGQKLIAHELTHVVQQKAAPTVLRQPIEIRKKDKAASKAAPEDQRLGALKAMFQLSIIAPVNKAYEALAAKEPDAKTAMSNLKAATVAYGTIADAYKSKPVFNKMAGVYNAMLAVQKMVEPYAGVQTPMSQILRELKPGGNIMSMLNSTLKNL